MLIKLKESSGEKRWEGLSVESKGGEERDGGSDDRDIPAKKR